MPDLADGESAEVKGSARLPYVLRNVGGVYSCTCPAWRNQSVAIERRTCKHLRKYRGDKAEEDRLGSALPNRPQPSGEEGAEESAGPPILLAQSWANDVDLAGWWMSEKLDGVRAYWNGCQFISRQGNLYHAPDWFVESLPETPLDGELWLARKSFQRTVSIVRRQDKSEHWHEISFLVFDAPAALGGFEERLAFVRDAVAQAKAKHVSALEHAQCRGLDHLREELARVEGLGGEGLMLREPGSKYEAGRSSTLLKVKTFHDAEARVVEHLPGAGRHKGRLGALAVELSDGTSFSVGTGFSDAQRESPPPVGSVITFRYQELSDRGVPRFPSFVRVQRAETESSSTLAPSAGGPSKVTRSVSEAPKKTRSVSEGTTALSPSTPNSLKTTQRFEFDDGKSAKFWEISVDGCDATVSFGRIGAAGQTQIKTLANPAAAQAHAEKLIVEKTKKGYVECAGS